MRKILFALALVASTSSAQTLEPAGGGIDHTYERKQYGYLRVNPVDGGYRVWVKFSNGKKVDGDHFGVNVAFFGHDGRPIKAIKMTAGVNAALGGRAREREIERLVPFDDTQREAVANVQCEFFKFQGVDDTEFWNRVKNVAETIVAAG